MARSLVKNASNYVSLPANAVRAALASATMVAFHCWFKPASFTATNYNNTLLYSQISDGKAGLWVSLHNGTSAVLKVGGRSTDSDSFQERNGTTSLAASSWYSLGGVWDFGTNAITPYVAGTAEGGGVVSFGSGTYTTGSTPTRQDGVGAFLDGSNVPTSTGEMAAGDLADLAIWKFTGVDTGLGAAGFSALSRGYSARLIRPDALKFFRTFIGRNPHEGLDLALAVPTYNGAVAQAEHPRVFRPTGARPLLAPAAGGGGPAQDAPELRAAAARQMAQLLAQ